MADSKISALTEATSLTGAEDFPLVQTTTKRCGIDTLFSSANAKWSGWVYVYTTGWVGTAGRPLTSASWMATAYSTTAKTLIDLSTVFGVPAGIKAVLMRVSVQDSASAASDTYLILSPNNVAAEGMGFSPYPVNSRTHRSQSVIPCDANGDIYYQISASGAATFTVTLNIWGYQL